MYFINFNDFQIIGSSPEILVRLRKNKITIRPIAGTRPRGLSAKKDAFYKQELLNDNKELSEHLMLLDLGRNDVGKVSKINSVKVTERFKVEKYSHVMHIVSNVEGKFNKKHSLLDTMLAGFPAGTVSGAPKIRAMEIIDELENTKRKMYAGAIGYFSANQNFDTCIALRTALIKNNKFYIQSGAGIVADSIPEKEYLETVKKKIDQGCEAIFLSPIFRITKNRQYLGVCRFNLLTLEYEKKFIALGGIRKQNINILKMLNIYGMAGISFLKKNRPKNLGRFL